MKGLSNLLDDISKGRIRQTDLKIFEVGENLAATKGKVVFQNDLMQLIQYEPTTKQVYETPLLIIPAWINKYYITDLSPENSMIKWMVDQGFMVFVVSWVNPDERHADKTFEDYMFEGPLAALGAIEKATGKKQINAMGYCLGGTLLSCLLSYMEAKKDKRIKTATFLTTLLDYEEAGDLAVFVDEEQLKNMETRMNAKGFLNGHEMGMTFNMLRSNDLIWSYVINNYLLGKNPFPFDILYWNSDVTRMPAKMHSFYLRNMYLNNNLSKGKITLGGVKIDIGRITIPCYFLSAKEDHIAPWRSTYIGAHMLDRKEKNKKVHFVLTASGHVAGVVNPPAKKKYSYWENEKHPLSPEEWLNTAHETEGSWWVNWADWASHHSGKKIPAVKVGSGKLKPLEDAPGSYVKVRI